VFLAVLWSARKTVTGHLLAFQDLNEFKEMAICVFPR
jgi:hypothetical protein